MKFSKMYKNLGNCFPPQIPLQNKTRHGLSNKKAQKLFQGFFSSLKCIWGTSPVVQWLRLCLPMQDARVRSLVWELRSHMPWGVAKNLKKNAFETKSTVTGSFEKQAFKVKLTSKTYSNYNCYHNSKWVPRSVTNPLFWIND